MEIATIIIMCVGITENIFKVRGQRFRSQLQPNLSCLQDTSTYSIASCPLSDVEHIFYVWQSNSAVDEM